MANEINEIVDAELEEFAKKIVQSKSVHYDMTYVDLFLLKDFHFHDLEKILKTRKIKTVFNCLKKHGFIISYFHFCDIVARGELKEKTRVQKTPRPKEKENSTSTNSDSSNRPRDKNFGLRLKDHDNSKLVQDALIKPSASDLKRIEELKKKNKEREEREKENQKIANGVFLSREEQE